MTDDILHSTQYYTRPLKLGRLMVLQETHLSLFCFHENSLFSSPHPLDFNILVTFSSKNVRKGHKLKLTYSIHRLDESCRESTISKYQNGMLKVVRIAFSVWHPHLGNLQILKTWVFLEWKEIFENSKTAYLVSHRLLVYVLNWLR